MLRRTWLTLLSLIPTLRRSAFAASGLAGAEMKALEALAIAVLPESLGEAKLRGVAGKFSEWISGYRPGADMEHGYGLTRMAVKPPSPLPAYRSQLAALGADFMAVPVAERRVRVTAALTNAGIVALPMAPSGQHIATDLMAFWFRSPEANDLCHQRAIRRYDCRGFATASQAPAALKGGRG